MSSKCPQGISPRAFTNDHYVDVVFRFHCQHAPGVFHLRVRLHTGLLINDFLIIDDHIFNEAEDGIASIANFKHAAINQILHWRDKKTHHADGETQAVESVPDTFWRWLTAQRDNTKCQNKQRHQIAVPREYGHYLAGFFQRRRVQRQQGIEIGRTVSLREREIHGGDDATQHNHTLLQAWAGTPQQQ
ncbi:FAD/NAD(P)-binding protein [Serratia sp. H1n]|uniref:FAD/NAD(P)-binding protein n=1 Tax=unclassified Serratia (in: enterobacteria) TaxID=2647522 RepID=UPI00350F43C4